MLGLAACQRTAPILSLQDRLVPDQKLGRAATMDIGFIRATYSIILNSTTNISQGSDSTISPHDNRWVQNPRKQIDSQLAIAGSQ
jgi:hypothetical protein